MKNFAITLIALFLAFGITACSESKSPEEAANKVENAADAVVDAAADAANAAPAAPAKPGYQEKAENMAATTVAFNTEEYDWSKVTEGEIVRHTFSFTNTGSEPLVIQNARASCGCTTPDWTKEPVAPGEEGKIEVEFNSKGRVGIQNKTVTVTGNFDGNINKILRIKGEVVAGDK